MGWRPFAMTVVMNVGVMWVVAEGGDCECDETVMRVRCGWCGDDG